MDQLFLDIKYVYVTLNEYLKEYKTVNISITLL